MTELEKLARKTCTPFGYFFLQTPPDEQLPVPDYRTYGARGVQEASPNLIETLYSMQRRQDWLREYLIEQGVDPLPFVGSAKLDTPITDVAAAVRSSLGLKADWAQDSSTWEDALRRLREVTDAAGILVVINGVIENNTHRKLDPKEFRGFVLSDAYAPLVFINGADFVAAQMFTMAHELAHIWIDQDALFDLEKLQPAPAEVEVFCDKVAAEFLVPETMMRSRWPEVANVDDPFSRLARRFKVSELVIARRALDLDLIPRSEFLSFYSSVSTAERRKQKGGHFWNTQNTRIGRRFAEAVVSAVKEGRLLYQEAYGLTGLYGNTFDTLVERVA